LRGKWLEIPNDFLKQFKGSPEFFAVTFRARGEGFGKRLHTALAALPHQADTFGGRFEAHAAAVFGGVAADQSRALEAGDDAAHGGWADLLGIGKFAKRSGATEDQDGESGELGGTDAAFAVADAKPPEQVNGGGVEFVGDLRGHESRRWFSQGGFFGSPRAKACGSAGGLRSCDRLDGRDGRRSAPRRDRSAVGGRSGFSSGAVLALDRRHGI